MERAVLLILLLPLFALACSSGRPGTSDARPAAPAEPAQATQPPAPEPPAAPSAPAASAASAASPACDYKVVPMSDPAQRQIQCGSGESFVVRRGNDGKWYEEMRVRAGTRPGYATPEDAAKARCCGSAE